MEVFFNWFGTQSKAYTTTFTILFFLVVVLAGSGIYWGIKGLLKGLKDFKFKTKVGELSYTDKDSPSLPLEQVITQTLSKILDLAHERTSTEIDWKKIAFEDQKRYFADKRLGLFYKIKNSYEHPLKDNENLMKNSILIEHWLEPLTKRCLEDIDNILIRNHLKSLPEDEFEGKVEDIFEKAYNTLLESAKNQPGYIDTSYKIIEKAIEDNKGSIKDYFKDCFDKSRSISIRLGEDLEKLKKEFDKNYSDLISEITGVI